MVYVNDHDHIPMSHSLFQIMNIISSVISSRKSFQNNDAASYLKDFKILKYIDPRKKEKILLSFAFYQIKVEQVVEYVSYQTRREAAGWWVGFFLN